jgi:hypothetical protein
MILPVSSLMIMDATCAGLMGRYPVRYAVQQEGDQALIVGSTDGGPWTPWDLEQTRRFVSTEVAMTDFVERLVRLRQGARVWHDQEAEALYDARWAAAAATGWRE